MRSCPSEGLPAGYSRRAISDTRWEPKGHTLAVTLSLVPAPDSQQQPKLELWQIDVEAGGLKQLSDLGRAWRPYFSPDGSAYLVLQYGSDEKPEGTLSLVNAKSGKGKTVLTFPASPAKNGYDNQVVWTPDSKAAWVAIPTPDHGAPTPPNGTKLYRVSGRRRRQGSRGYRCVGGLLVPGRERRWPTPGRRTKRSRRKSCTWRTPDGTQAPHFTRRLNQGEFISWSPKGSRFIYQDNFQVFAGAPGQKPVRLANATSVYMPRWISDNQVIALQDTGDGWLLAVRDVDGAAAGLMPLPREAMWDLQTSR